MIKVAVLDDYQRRADGDADWGLLGPEVEVVFFHETIPPTALVQTLEEFEVLVLMRERTAFRRAVLEALPKLQLLVTTGMGNASVDIGYLNERGVVVCGTGRSGGSEAPGVPSTAEVAWALILALCKRVTLEDHAIREGRWQLDLPTNLSGATLGLAGLGHLGGAMVGPARAFGMDVIAWSENLTQARADDLGVRRVSKEELLAESDVLGIFLVLSDRTLGLFQRGDLAQMKPTAFIVNISRGPIIEESALLEALQNGTIAGAGLDVFEREPLPKDHPFRTAENVVLMPHVGYVTEAGFRDSFEKMAENVAAFLAGAPIRVVE